MSTRSPLCLVTLLIAGALAACASASPTAVVPPPATPRSALANVAGPALSTAIALTPTSRAGVTSAATSESGGAPTATSAAGLRAPTATVPSARPAPLNVPTRGPTATVRAGQLVDQFVTFYGWPDNDPPGNAIAYPRSRFPQTLHEGAGGTGTYEDPITVASDPTDWAIGTPMYVPYLRKYVIMEDYCAGCVESWQRQRKHHIDVWMNSDAAGGEALVACQRRWTRSSAPIEIDPPPDRPVDLRALFDRVTRACLDPQSIGASPYRALLPLVARAFRV